MASLRTDEDRPRDTNLVFFSDGRSSGRIPIHQLQQHPKYLEQERAEARLKPESEARRKRQQRRRARRRANSLLSSSRENGPEEHVGGSAQEQADPFSEQPAARIGDKGKSPMGILVEEEDLVSYRRDWESSWGGTFGLFRDYTCVRAMLFTCRPTPPHAGVKTCLQIFSIKVAEVDEALKWPLEIYGLVATRDSVDHNRNIIFRRERDACQFLTEQGSLMLTGPSRAVVFTDPVDIEIQLKVKGITEREDKDLISKVLVYGRDFGSDNSGGSGHLVRSTCSSKLCSLEVTSQLVAGAVEATIISTELIQGRWPQNLGIRVVSGTASLDEDLVLLDARDGMFRVDLADSVINLSRHIVCVEKDGRLKLSVVAYKRNGDICEASGVTTLTPKRFSASIGICKLPFCTVRFTIGWSCLANASDLKSYGI